MEHKLKQKLNQRIRSLAPDHKPRLITSTATHLVKVVHKSGGISMGDLAKAIGEDVKTTEALVGLLRKQAILDTKSSGIMNIMVVTNVDHPMISKWA